MPKQIHFAVVLFLIAAVCVGGIDLVYSMARENIRKNEREAKMRGVRMAFGFKEDEKVEFEEKAVKDDKSGKTRTIYAHEKGFALESAKGAYDGPVVTIVAVSRDLGTVLGTSVILQTETPGFGAKIVEKPVTKTLLGGADPDAPTDGIPKYQKGYYGLDKSELKPKSVKDCKKVDAISGATITSQALYDAVKAGVETLEKLAPKIRDE